MNLTFKPPTLEDCQKVRIWRNDCLETLRTPIALTEKEQEQFYNSLHKEEGCPHVYWSIYDGDKFVAFGGLTYISTTNRNAEISLIVNPDFREQGYGKECAFGIIRKGFDELNLQTIYGEVYNTNKAGVEFWLGILEDRYMYATILPARKMWNDVLYNSIYFSIDGKRFNTEPQRIIHSA